MKILINFLFLTVFSTCVAQGNAIYLEVSKNQIVGQNNDFPYVYEVQMPVKHINGKGIDYYNFIINSGEKSMDEIGIEISDPKFISLEDLQKKSPCETHELISDSRNIYLVVKDQNGVYRKWICMYLGTVKNTVKMKAQY